MTAVPLAPLLDTAAAPSLRLELLTRLELRRSILLDGSAVTRVGQACLQVMASARAVAIAEGLSFAVTQPSATLRDMATLARLDTVLEPVG